MILIGSGQIIFKTQLTVIKNDIVSCLYLDHLNISINYFFIFQRGDLTYYILPDYFTKFIFRAGY